MLRRLIIVASLCCSSELHAVTFDWTTIGSAGNAADTTGYGAVDYAYRMSRHEVTNAQYVEFLNSVAATDTHALYQDEIASYPEGGIVRSGSPGNYHYTLKEPVPGEGQGGSAYTYDKKPVTTLTFLSAVRFANWLHNGQPNGIQDATTTEDGAYTLTNTPLLPRNPGARFFLPSDDEWYKAAYYAPAVGGTGGYYDYPTGSNASPDNNSPALDSGNSANYSTAAGNGAYPMTDVGSYSASPSPYGTFDQGGNVAEWTEGFLIDSIVGPSRIWRGGDYVHPVSVLSSSTRLSIHQLNSGRNIGFRIAAAVPEPTSFALVSCAGSGLLLRRRVAS